MCVYVYSYLNIFICMYIYRHWTEQCMQITHTEVLLRKNHDAIRVSLRIPHRSIIRVRPMPPEMVPIKGYSYFQIDTFAREHYFLVRSCVCLIRKIEYEFCLCHVLHIMKFSRIIQMAVLIQYIFQKNL
jgi:hypothetical protein